MKSKNRVIQALQLTIAALFACAFLVRCASMMTPEGGPRDTLAPVIVAMSPDNFTTNFKDKKIYIEFNEFIQLKDQQKEFFASPSMKTKPSVQIKGRGIEVTLPDSLTPNTTYALNFGSSIRDNNEGNPLYSMRYVFSTGDVIDSLMLSGYAEDNFKSDSVSGALLFFFEKDSLDITPDYDSTLFNRTPAVIAKAENNGIFLAQNLKAKEYKIYAIDDTNNNFIYEPGVDKVSFNKTLHNPAQMPQFAIWLDSIRNYIVAQPQVHFRLFTDKAFSRQILDNSARPLQNKAMLYFSGENPTIESIRFDSIPNDKIILEPQGTSRDTVVVWFNVQPSLLPDTIRGEVTYLKHDSIRVLRSTTEPLRLSWRKVESREKKKEKEQQERAKRKAAASGEKYEEPKAENPFAMRITTKKNLTPKKPITFETTYPLSKINTDSISLSYMMPDSITYPLRFRVERDSVKLTRYHIYADFNIEEANYKLLFKSGALENIAFEKSDSLSSRFAITKRKEASTVTTRIKRDAGDRSFYNLDITDSKGNIISGVNNIKDGSTFFDYIPVGTLKIRVTQDLDRNGVFSDGDLVKQRQPERVVYVEQDGKNSFDTKANWSYEFDVNLSELFAEEDMQRLNERLEREESARIKKEQQDKIEKQKNDSSSASQGSMFGGAIENVGNQINSF
ncbi:MAG: Ig-like domain-containing protein [Rikenellaceae bacterium]